MCIVTAYNDRIFNHFLIVNAIFSYLPGNAVDIHNTGFNNKFIIILTHTHHWLQAQFIQAHHQGHISACFSHNTFEHCFVRTIFSDSSIIFFFQSFVKHSIINHIKFGEFKIIHTFIKENLTGKLIICYIICQRQNSYFSSFDFTKNRDSKANHNQSQQ